MLASRFNKANLELCDGSFSPFRAKPHKLSALRLNTWLCVLREISFVVAATISSPFKWHQTGGTLFQAYKWPSVQVLHLIHRQSQIADRPRMEFSKWFIVFFYSPFKRLASLISLGQTDLSLLCYWKLKAQRPDTHLAFWLRNGLWWYYCYCSIYSLLFNMPSIIIIYLITLLLK